MATRLPFATGNRAPWDARRTEWSQKAKSLVAQTDRRMLEIGCGTGYFTQIFFAPLAREIVAMDVDARTIETARRMHAAKNVRYEVMDARTALPHEGPFDAVVWTPSIFAYTVSEFDMLMSSMRATLQGLLCGWTFVELDKSDPDVLWFDMKSLSARLRSHFANVRVIEHSHSTIEPQRQVLVFYASNGPLPFDLDWPHSARL